MRKVALDFIRRGLIACGFGPVFLAILYMILESLSLLETLEVSEVIVGIFSLCGLAFVAGGMNAIYQIEQLPLMAAVTIHGSVLYLCYLVTYLINDWIELGTLPILAFSVIFVVGYLLIWAVVYYVVRRKTARLNEMLKKNQKNIESY